MGETELVPADAPGTTSGASEQLNQREDHRKEWHG